MIYGTVHIAQNATPRTDNQSQAAGFAIDTSPAGRYLRLEKMNTRTFWHKTLVSGLLTVVILSCTPAPVYPPRIPDVDPQENINQLLDAYTDSHVDTGCDMKLLINGEESDPVFWQLISSATDTIDIETLNFDNDSEHPENVSQKYIDLLTEKVRQGVTVNLILDPTAQRFYYHEDTLDALRAAGANVRYFFPPLEKILLDQILYRTHKKLLIVDGRQAIIGGMNYGFLYLAAGQWRDTNALLTGPVVASMQREFMRDWESLGDPVPDPDRYFPTLEPTGNLSVRTIDQRPAVDDMDINTFVLIALRSANNHVDIEAPYFNPTDWLADEILKTAARGVRVRILTNSATSVDIPTVFYVTASFFRPMIDGGVEIYMWNQAGHTMHSKTMVVDDKLAMLGSYNFNCRSIIWDTETIAVFTDPHAVSQVQNMFDNDLDPNRIIPVDDAWLDAQPPENQSLWNTANDFSLFF